MKRIQIGAKKVWLLYQQYLIQKHYLTSHALHAHVLYIVTWRLKAGIAEPGNESVNRFQRKWTRTEQLKNYYLRGTFRHQNLFRTTVQSFRNLNFESYLNSNRREKGSQEILWAIYWKLIPGLPEQVNFVTVKSAVKKCYKKYKRKLITLVKFQIFKAS
jgi:hypothetical protein